MDMICRIARCKIIVLIDLEASTWWIVSRSSADPDDARPSVNSRARTKGFP